MRLSPSRFNRFVANIGQEILWRRSYACSCVSPTTGAPNPKHAVCSGKGRIWDEPIQFVAGVPSQNTYQKMIIAGLWETGDMALTIPESCTSMWSFSGRLDRVTMLNSTDVFSLPLTRGAVTEKLFFCPVSIDRVFWFDEDGEIVEGDKPAVSADGVISWDDVVNAPASGISYSMTGTKYSEYFIYDHFPSDRNEHQGRRLPKRVQLRVWDLFGR